MNTVTARHIETLVGHADGGIDALPDMAPPIHQTAPFQASSDEEFAAMASTPRHSRNYTRDGNPTFTRVEAILVDAERPHDAERRLGGKLEPNGTEFVEP